MIRGWESWSKIKESEHNTEGNRMQWGILCWIKEGEKNTRGKMVKAK